MKRQVRKVAVLGSGVMGSAIAAHFANAGIPSLVLDIDPRDRPIGWCLFPREGIPEVCDLPMLDGVGPGSEVTVRFRVWEETSQHALLFEDIAVVRASRPPREVSP